MKNAFSAYSRTMSAIILWQLFMFSLFLAGLVCLKRLAVHLKFLSGSSVTASDFTLLLTTMPGICFVSFALLLLCLFTLLDTEIKILWADHVLSDTKASFGDLLRQAFLKIPDFVRPGGPSLLLFLTFFQPLLGIGAAAMAGRTLKLSDFALADLVCDPAHTVIVGMLMIFLLFLGLFNLFTLPGILLSGKNVAHSLVDNIRLMKRYHREMFQHFFLPGLLAMTVLAGFGTAVITVSLDLIPRIVTDPSLQQFISAWFLVSGMLLALAGYFFLQAMLWLRRIQLYHMIRIHPLTKVSFRKRKNILGLALIILFLCSTAGYPFAASFDKLFPSGNSIRIIAHRAGGNLACENSASGILAAEAAGVFGCEIDVQRTLDGHYIVTHDPTFERVANDSRQPCEMTLRQVLQLNVRNTWDASLPSDRIATLEEILDVSKPLQKLYIELKGVTADMQMAKDIIRMVRERDMQDQVALISLNAELILSVEEQYPEIETGLLYHTPLYNAASMPVDLLMMQQNKAAASVIHAIHRAGKKAIVWTVDSWDTMAAFLNSDVDAIITDYVPHLLSMQKSMASRSLPQRIWDSLHYRLQLF